MARQLHKNTYTGGMDKDTSVNKYTPDKYVHSENIRINTIDGLSDGVIENIIGTKATIDLEGGAEVIGIEELGDNIILFVFTVNVPVESPPITIFTFFDMVGCSMYILINIYLWFEFWNCIEVVPIALEFSMLFNFSKLIIMLHCL